MKYQTFTDYPNLKEVSKEEFEEEVQMLADDQMEEPAEGIQAQLEGSKEEQETFSGSVYIVSVSSDFDDEARELESFLHIEEEEELIVYRNEQGYGEFTDDGMIYMIAKGKEVERYFLLNSEPYDILHEEDIFRETVENVKKELPAIEDSQFYIVSHQ